MGESDERFANLVPMRVRQDSVQSTVADYLQHEAVRKKSRIVIDGQIGDVVVSRELLIASSSSGRRDRVTANADGSTSSNNADTSNDDYNEALTRFMRNEIAYDEFMQLTGGIGLNEEAADFDEAIIDDDDDGDDDDDDDDDEYDEAHIGNVSAPSRRHRHRHFDSASANETEGEEDDEDEDDDEDDLLAPSTSTMRALGSVAINHGGKSESTRIVVTTKNGEEIDEERLLGIPLELRNSSAQSLQQQQQQQQSSAPNKAIQQPSPFVQRNKLNKTLDALLGQANVIYAKGQTKDALTMLLEVIRQEPRSPDAYRLVADIYKEMNQPHKSLQYGLLAAHLNSRTPADEWVELGNLAYKLQRIEEAAACFGRAIKMEPTNWRHYEKRIETLDAIGLRPVAMKTRLMAAQNIDQSSAKVDFDWFEKLIKTVAEYYIQLNDEERAIQALEAFVLRSREFGRKADTQHQILVGMWMMRQRFEDAAKSIFALCPGITALDENGKFAMEITYNNAGYTVSPFPPPKVHRFVVSETFSIVLLIRLIICFIRLGRRDLVPPLFDKLFEREILPEADQALYVEIARAYQVQDCTCQAQKYVEHLLTKDCFAESSDVWFLYGQLLWTRRKFEESANAYEHVLELQPGHVDARINLSTIQQRLGMTEKAFETLRDYDLDAGSSLPDERLLIRQADFLSQQKRTDQFVRCVRMLLTPHFYMVYQGAIAARRRPSAGTSIALCHGLRTAAFNAINGSTLEKFVKRLGAITAAEERPHSEMTATQLHDYAFKLLEILISQQRYADGLHVCCYAYLQPTISKTQKTVETFHNLLMFCAMKANCWPLAFEYLRWFYSTSLSNHSLLMPTDRDLLFTRIFNAMNSVFCHSQNVSYHRYVMRALVRMPGNVALQMISGNNSLITGAYRHALGEYLRVWFQVPDNPLICLLLALTFTHMACKKDISSRHMVALRGIAFMNRYQRLRGDCQEASFNIARMFHQMNVLPLATHFYRKCLDADAPLVLVTDEENDEQKIVPYQRYDLRPLAAHNLALIYETSGNIVLARELLLKYCVIE